jgi:hypothetical protein
MNTAWECNSEISLLCFYIFQYSFILHHSITFSTPLSNTLNRSISFTVRGKLQFIKKLIHHSHSALEARLEGTRAQSCDRYGFGTLHPCQVLGLVCHFFPPPLEVPTFAAMCLYVRQDARNPSSERGNCGQEIVQ